MSSHKLKAHLEKIKDEVNKTDMLTDEQKADSVKRIEEWVMEDRAFGTLKDELMQMSVFFEKLFAELGLD